MHQDIPSNGASHSGPPKDPIPDRQTPDKYSPDGSPDRSPDTVKIIAPLRDVPADDAGFGAAQFPSGAGKVDYRTTSNSVTPKSQSDAKNSSNLKDGANETQVEPAPEGAGVYLKLIREIYTAGRELSKAIKADKPELWSARMKLAYCDVGLNFVVGLAALGVQFKSVNALFDPNTLALTTLVGIFIHHQVKKILDTSRPILDAKLTHTVTRLFFEGFARDVIAVQPERWFNASFSTAVSVAKSEFHEIAKFVGRQSAFFVHAVNFLTPTILFAWFDIKMTLALLGCAAFRVYCELRNDNINKKVDEETRDDRRGWNYKQHLLFSNIAASTIRGARSVEKVLDVASAQYRRIAKAQEQALSTVRKLELRGPHLLEFVTHAAIWVSLVVEHQIVGGSLMAAGAMIWSMLSLDRASTGMSDLVREHIKNWIPVKRHLETRADAQNDLLEQKTKSFKRLDLTRAPEIEFCNVSYEVNNKHWNCLSPEQKMKKTVLKNLSFKIDPGTTLGLCGPSGSGKTTIVRLLLREIRPTSGKILINGINLWDISPDDLTSLTAIMAQNYFEWSSFTIRESFQLGTPLDPDLDKIREAFNFAGVRFIDPLGPDMDQINGADFINGRPLSGGEGQMLAVVRHNLHSGLLRISDEPTAKIDGRVEEEIINSLNASKGEVKPTGILVSHRYSNIKLMDRILYVYPRGSDTPLDAATQVEIGTHAELMRLNGEYARMYSFEAGRY